MWDYCARNASLFAEYAYHTAMVLFAVSYALRDIFWLRVVAVVAGLLGVPYFLACEEPNWPAVFWNTLFVTIHIIRLGMLLHERRSVSLSDEQQRLHQLVFRALTPGEFSRLLEIAEWRDAPPGTPLIAPHRTLMGLIVIYSGTASVRNGGVEFAVSRDGQCVGEMSFITGMPPSATVVARTELRYVFLPKDRLDALMAHDARIREVVYSVLGFDMAEKLIARAAIDHPATEWRIDRP